MEHVTAGDLASAAGGRLLCGDPQLPIVHISIDSRTMKGQDLFVPLIGEKVDAHRFIAQAFEAGAVAVLTSEHDEMEDPAHPWIRVEDTKKALQDIGRYYRSRLSLPLIGITGSVGKTTTREMVAAALSAKYRVYKTPGNSNSQVGVPITLSEITGKDEIGVLELGMSMPGELTVIAGIAQVDMAVITNVGVTHIEQLGSQENIFREKMTIQDGLKDGGILFLNGDDPMLKTASAKAGCRTVFYGTGENSSYRAEDIRIEDGFPVFTAVCAGRRVPVSLRVMGRHNVLNAMVALAVACENGISPEAAAAALGTFAGFKNRQQIYEKGGVTVIDDTYNASPVSMLAGLEVLLSRQQAKRHIAVLADMKELGPQAPEYHRQIGTWLLDHPVDILFTLGDLAKEIETAAGAGAGVRLHFDADDRAGLLKALEENVQPGDCVLLKGSNSMKLGEVAEGLLKLLSQNM
ncbi:MAG: UDP-N-acetylmuramoyl-tripeptide--D-alanyl-D-alanine ligase [Eubacteriales bacterium]|nr:UDP-N-acetylmuramoyl-tripeptide--D-alanyl-D-alanine ligase [Eubacteriales bacterium]